MGRAYRCINHASPEVVSERARAVRPALPAPDGTESWYRISNSLDAGSSPVAEISIYGDIGSWGITAAAFVEELKAIDAPELKINIASPGGDVFDGLAIHSALRSHRAKVIVQVDSLAASIASVIAMAGDRVIMGAHAQLMIHEAAGVTCGNAEEMREYADFLDRQSDNIAGVYQERAGGTVKQWRARMRQETWYFADEAVEAGLADEVAKPMRYDDEDMPGMDDRAMAAAWDLSVYNYAHTSREQAPAPPLDTATPTHHTATVDSPWDAGPNERRLPSPMSVATAKKAYGWYDPEQVEDGKLPKSACKLPHHEVSGDGTPGAANLAGVRNALARLPQSDIPEAQRAAVEAHLRAHLADGKGAENVARQFAEGDRVRVTVTPHEEGQTTGTVAEVNGNAYGITFDGMEAMGVHRWYVDNELESEDGAAGPAPMAAVFDPAAFRTAATAALDPMPGYQPDHLRSLMAGLAGDAPAPAAPQQADTPYVPPPVDTVPEVPRGQVAAGYMHSLFTGAALDAPAVPAQVPAETPYMPPPVDTVPDAPPQQVAVDYWRSLFTAAANDAPTAPQTARPQAAAPAPEVVYVPEPPAPAGQVAADYLRTVLTNVARDAPAPPSTPAPGPQAPEPISPVDQTVRRALWEAEL